jgi:RNA-directed DNA polymerase
MSQLAHLKTAASLHDVADILGFKPKAVAFILYAKPDSAKYYQFEIPKRSGGTRTISAPYPDLKKLQQRLSDVLQNVVGEINEIHHIKSTISHGFTRKHSIITNAAVHRRKRFVFNIDLEDFFGAINFGRVRGYFIKNQDFTLHADVATVIAQIACHQNKLPQGSPCSPVISNLVGHLLDIRLAALAHSTGCHYSRYADDLTFSTNKKDFPAKIAKLEAGEEYIWKPAKRLESTIVKTGFSINGAKTRMQLRRSRQDVTGLVVNRKVNVRSEYKRIARAMTHRVLTTGAFYRRTLKSDGKGGKTVEKVDGTIDQLSGILSFIDSVRLHGKKPADQSSNDSTDTLYSGFLFYKRFYAGPAPLIVCEGKTDNIYIRAAIRQLADDYPQLASKTKEGITLKVKLFKYTPTSARILGLTGGISDLAKFVRSYERSCGSIGAEGMKHPVVLLVDNDDGATGKGGIYAAIKDVTKGAKPDGTQPFYAVKRNLYVVPTPLGAGAKSTMIEDFFDPALLKTKLGGKTLNLGNKGFDGKTEYGKYLFGEYVVKPEQDKIDFKGFRPILDRIVEAIEKHG